MPEVRSGQDYYAFGKAMPGRGFAATAGYRFGYNGMEYDNDWFKLDYIKRIFSPDEGRFFSIDPLFGAFPFYSSYQFAGNMPIMAIDLDGAEEHEVVTRAARESGRVALQKSSANITKELAKTAVKEAAKNGGSTFAETAASTIGTSILKAVGIVGYLLTPVNSVWQNPELLAKQTLLKQLEKQYGVTKESFSTDNIPNEAKQQLQNLYALQAEFDKIKVQKEKEKPF